jgi:hypothetical protein
MIANISNSFLNLPTNYQQKQQQQTNQLCNPLGCGCSERTIYRNYLLGLRKTRKMLNNSTNINNKTINNLVSILNFTSKFVSNYTTINNTQMGAKNLVMANIILDVSNVKEIHIKTNKDVLIVELDKKERDYIPELFTNVNNIDNILSTISLLAKLLNIT